MLGICGRREYESGLDRLPRLQWHIEWSDGRIIYQLEAPAAFIDKIDRGAFRAGLHRIRIAEDSNIDFVDRLLSTRRRIHSFNADAPDIHAIALANVDDHLGTEYGDKQDDRCVDSDATCRNEQRLRGCTKLF